MITVLAALCSMFDGTKNESRTMKASKNALLCDNVWYCIEIKRMAVSMAADKEQVC